MARTKKIIQKAKKFKSPERFLQPDPRYKSKLVSKFINCLMYAGKKTASQKIFYSCMDEIGNRVRDVEPIEVFNRAINNVKPVVEVRSKRVGGATYQVPKEVEKKRQLALAIRWILEASRGKKGRPMHLRLADELAAAYRKEGAAIQKRENVHKMALVAIERAFGAFDR
ncbi:MAG: 30S ribosomal protein S7 [Planctomycetota bacterium]